MPLPTALDYARHHGLAIDHKSQDLFLLLNHLQPVSCEVHVDLPDLAFSDFEQVVGGEKLQLGQEASKVLAQGIQLPATVESCEFLFDPYHLSKVKQDVPMLRMDHEQDMKWFRKKLDLSRLVSGFSDLFVEASPVLKEPDFMLQCINLAGEIDLEVKSEKMQMSKEILQFLSNMLRDKWAVDDAAQAMERGLNFERHIMRHSPSPSLTPPFEPPGFQLPPVPDLVLEPRSEEDVDLDNLLLQVEKEMRKQDNLTFESPSGNHGCASDLNPVLHSPVTPVAYYLDQHIIVPPSNERKRKRSSPLYRVLDSPWDSLSTSSHVSGPDTRSKARKTENKSVRSRGAPPLLHTVRDEEMHGHVEQESIENTFNTRDEGLQASDIDLLKMALCVAVPALPETHSDGQLNPRLPQTSTFDLLRVTKNSMKLQDVAKEDKMNWSPFPSELLRTPTNERMDCGDKFKHFWAKPASVIRSEQLLWKQDGLRILDCDDNSDEEMIFEDDFDAEELHAGVQQSSTSSPAREQDLAGSFSLPTKHKPNTHRVDLGAVRPAIAKKSDSTQLLGMSIETAFTGPAQLRPFSDFDLNGLKSLKKFERSVLPYQPSQYASEGFSAFLVLHGKRFKKPEEVCASPKIDGLAREIFSDPIQVSQASASRVSNFPHTASIRNTEVQVPSSQETLLKHTWLPKVNQLYTPSVIFVDTALLKNRALMQIIDEQSNDNLQIVYRDLDESPDIILDPKSCIIHTNIQALMQKSLPGQTGLQSSGAQIQQRVVKLCSTFEHIFVVISVPNLQQCHANELNDFTSFCASLRSSSSGPLTVSPIWVSIGEAAQVPVEPSSDPTSTWIWSLISKHAFPLRQPQINAHHDMVFFDEETLWERFLREAGINTMAAQVLLTSVKRTSATKADEPWGLRKLLQMDVRDRIHRFGDVVGHTSLSKLQSAID